MECNKEEAERAAEIAQRKLGMKDLEGARKFAVKAQQLYPPLPALSQLMPILDVLLAAHHSTNTETDWYAILQLDDINVMADDSLVRKQYRKLALLLHPDKNKIVGSESAFKLIVDAWGVLSDKIRRAIYDQKRKANPHLKTHPQNPKRPPQRRATPKKKPPENGCFNGGRGSTTCGSSVAAPNLTQQNKSVNFWTVCPCCGMQYEYLCLYENKNLLCRNCRKPFLAVKAAAIPLSAMSNFSNSCHPWSYASVGSNNSPNSFGTGVGGFVNGVIPNLNIPWTEPFESAGPNVATVDSTAENVKASRGNVVGSKGNESHKENLPEKNEFDVLIKTLRKQKVPEACKPLASPFHDAPSSCKASVSPKVPLFTMETSSPKSNSGKAAWSPKVASFTMGTSSLKAPSCTMDSFPPKASFPNFSAKKRNFDDCSQGCEEEFNARKSQCSRKDIDLNKVDAEVFDSDAGKEQPKKSFPEVAFTSPQRANQSNKSFGKQVPATLRKDFMAKSVRDLLAEKAKMDIRKNLSEVKRKAEQAAAAKEEAEKAAAAKEEAEKAAAAKEKAMAAAAKKEALAAAAKKEALAAARKRTVEDELRKASVSAKSPDKVKKCAKIEKNEIQNVSNRPVFYKPVFYKKTYKKQEEVMKSEIVEKTAFDSRSISVPDSDFYDFDKDRTENCFDTNQIWATYDDENGMPRFYARIVRVVSLDPFKVQMNWIEPKLNKYQTCGEFTVGKVISSYLLNMYSHLMKWEKSPKGIFTIVPRKSDVWALYREWDSNWDDNTPAETRHKYEIVEVLTDFSDELGVSVVPLVKVPCFRNLFRKQHLASQPCDEWVVPKAELLRFSHQIPARRITKEDSPNIPEGCWELDPAATPLDVLCQGNTETKTEEPWTGEKEKASEERGGEVAETKTKYAEFEIKIELGEESAAG